MLEGGPGDDHIIGHGDGTDTASYEHATGGVTVDLSHSGPRDTGGAGVDTLSNISNLFGSQFDDHLIGDNGNNVLDGGFGGHDTLTGGAGNDTFVFHGNQLTVTDFQHGQDQIDVSYFGFTVNEAPPVILPGQTTASGSIIVPAGAAGSPLTALAASYLTDSHDLVNGLGGSAGFGENALVVGDDNSSSAINITSVFGSQGLNFFGHDYTSIYINNNGNITFAGPSSTFTPSQITAGANNPIIAAFWADVDTRGEGGHLHRGKLNRLEPRLL